MPAPRALALNCSLKATGSESSTDILLQEVLDALAKHGVSSGPPLRLADRTIAPGVTSDAEGPDDEWPAIRAEILASDILVLGTPIWLGQPSSIAKRVLERLDAFLGEQDDQGRMISYDRVAVVAVVGNEDGAHHVSAELYQALNDVGFTIPASAVTYWVGEARGGTDYKDLQPRPESVASATATVARHAAHLARLLAADGYPAS